MFALDEKEQSRLTAAWSATAPFDLVGEMLDGNDQVSRESFIHG